MENFFDFVGMAFNYKERKIARYDGKYIIVDTVAVTDSDQPFETAVSCSFYNEGNWIIVEMYNTKEKAQQGHERWVKKMTGDILPEALTDVSSSEISKKCDVVKKNKNWRLYDKQSKQSTG